MKAKRILIVDDEASVTRSLKINLESLGQYEVLTENHPSEVLAAARSFRPDLILLDVIMPEMDGGEVAARLWADPFLQNIPIIFLTAIVSNEEAKGHRMLNGLDTFLAKPVETGVLVDCIEQALASQLQSHHFQPVNRA